MHLLPKKIRKKAPFCNLFSISLYLSLFFSVCYITFFYFLTNCHVISCLHSTKFFLFYQKNHISINFVDIFFSKILFGCWINLSISLYFGFTKCFYLSYITLRYIICISLSFLYYRHTNVSSIFAKKEFFIYLFYLSYNCCCIFAFNFSLFIIFLLFYLLISLFAMFCSFFLIITVVNFFHVPDNCQSCNFL